MQGKHNRCISTAFDLSICVKVVVIVDVVFPVRIGAECGAVKERLSDPEGGESVQREGADSGTFTHEVSV